MDFRLYFFKLVLNEMTLLKEGGVDYTNWARLLESDSDLSLRMCFIKGKIVCMWTDIHMRIDTWRIGNNLKGWIMYNHIESPFVLYVMLNDNMVNSFLRFDCLYLLIVELVVKNV